MRTIIFIFFVAHLLLIVCPASSQDKTYTYQSYQGPAQATLSANKFLLRLDPNYPSGKTLEDLNVQGIDAIDTIWAPNKEKLIVIKSKAAKTVSLTTLRSIPGVSFAMPVFVSKDKREFGVTNRFTVVLNEGFSRADLDAMNASLGTRIVFRDPYAMRGESFILQTAWNSELDVFDITAQYRSNPAVRYAEPDFLSFEVPAFTATTISDPRYSQQWYLATINAEGAWNYTTGSSSIIIAVLDHGVDLGHIDLAGQLVQGYDALNGDNDPSPDAPPGPEHDLYAHGTACAGIIAAAANDTLIRGLAHGCRVMPVRIASGSTGVWSANTLAAGINWARDHGADVLSISGGFDRSVCDTNDTLENAIAAAATEGRNGKGCVIVAATGNHAAITDRIDYPAASIYSLAVGATDRNDWRRPYSQYGVGMGVMAPSSENPPGIDAIATLDLSGNYGSNSTDYYPNFGLTSASAPQVAALAGLILSRNPNYTREQVYHRIEGSAKDCGNPGYDTEYGWGRIDAASALHPPTTSGTITARESWVDATISLTGNVTVASGASLHIWAGTTVNMNGFNITLSGGTMVVDDGATITGLLAYLRQSTWPVKGLYGGAIQSAINDAADNDKVDIVSGMYTGDLSVNNKTNLTITGTQFYSIVDGTLSVTDCPGLWLTNITCNKVIAYYCNGSYFYGDIAGLSNDVGYKIVCCPDFQQGGLGYGYVYNCTTGLWAYNCTGDVLSSANFQDNLTSVLASDGADVYCHSAHFCTSTTYDLKVQGGGYIGAYDCYYSNGTPRTLNFRGQGTIYTSGAYTCGLPKLLADASSTGTGIPAVATDPDASAETEFSAISLAYFALTKDIREDIQAKGTLERDKFYARFVDATNSFKKFIQNHPHSPLAKAALSTAAQSFWRFEDYEAKRQFLADIIADDSLAVLRPLAKQFMIDYYKDIKEFDRAIKAADDFISDRTNDPEPVSLAIFAKGMILLNGMHQPEKASECFTTILNTYPESPIADFARNQLAIPKGGEPNQPPKESQAATGGEFTVTNYPNPFNPTTTFTFVLPSGGAVSLAVYDVLGREVAVLASGYHEAGSHSTSWNASNVASGVYFARLTVANQYGAVNYTKVNKLVLMK